MTGMDGQVRVPEADYIYRVMHRIMEGGCIRCYRRRSMSMFFTMIMDFQRSIPYIMHPGKRSQGLCSV